MSRLWENVRLRSRHLVQRSLDVLLPHRRRIVTLTKKHIASGAADLWFRGSPWSRHYCRYALRRCRQICDPQLPVVDIGCGVGQVIYALRLLQFNILTGVDISDRNIDAASSILRATHTMANLVVADGSEWMAANRSKPAGAIFALNWTYHLRPESMRGFLESASSSLSIAGGALFIDIIDSEYVPSSEGRMSFESSYPNKWGLAQLEALAFDCNLRCDSKAAFEYGRHLFVFAPRS